MSSNLIVILFFRREELEKIEIARLSSVGRTSEEHRPRGKFYSVALEAP